MERYILMPLMQSDLHDRLHGDTPGGGAPDPMTDGRVRLRIAIEAAEALAHVASKRVVHCDVKLANVVSKAFFSLAPLPAALEYAWILP